jgi:hypothetical protein
LREAKRRIGIFAVDLAYIKEEKLSLLCGEKESIHSIKEGLATLAQT